MSNSNFNKNGVDKFGTHWLQYAAFVVTAFAIYFASRKQYLIMQGDL